MGIDLKAGGRAKQRSMREAKTSNVYHRLLIKLFEFLSRRGESKFAPTVLKRLNMSRVNRYPMSLSRVAKNLKAKEDKIAVCVCSVVDDNRMLTVPKMTVCALRFSEVARQRIVSAGGQCLTLDQLVLKAPTGNGTLLMRGPKSREALSHFGKAPGTKHARTKPYLNGKKSRNTERGRKG